MWAVMIADRTASRLFLVLLNRGNADGPHKRRGPRMNMGAQFAPKIRHLHHIYVSHRGWSTRLGMGALNFCWTGSKWYTLRASRPTFPSTS
jgi:hypothetical protein